MRNLVIAQERDKTRFRHVRSGNYDKSKAKFLLGQYVLVKQSKINTLQTSVHPHILRIMEIRDSGVTMLQGRCGATVSRHISQLAHCSVPVANYQIYPELFVRTDTVHCEICALRSGDAHMLLCDICDKGWHAFFLDPPLLNVPSGAWQCAKHKVKP